MPRNFDSQRKPFISLSDLENDKMEITLTDQEGESFPKLRPSMDLLMETDRPIDSEEGDAGSLSCIDNYSENESNNDSAWQNSESNKNWTTKGSQKVFNNLRPDMNLLLDQAREKTNNASVYVREGTKKFTENANQLGQTIKDKNAELATKTKEGAEAALISAQ